MARKKQQKDYAAELQATFDRWEHYRRHGGSDPFYEDGYNMNLLRNHIMHYKRQIAENAPIEHLPAIYHRDTPPEVDNKYMARKEEIRAAAQKALAMYKAHPAYQYLCRRISRLTKQQKEKSCISNVIGYVTGLEKAITVDDWVTMRRHERGSYTDSFVSCADRVQDMKPPDNEQLNLFTDYSNDYGNDGDYADENESFATDDGEYEDLSEEYEEAEYGDEM